ncbi:threonine/homoserine/homoserine lactone efflux protein [Litoreibacter meonggei]|uniref:Threonine/homoserine/homoserine lactone efflux protein n=1 Tax=Litoreibacter meonggei TaxID=1049199 RepID=A0A497VF16_9RHOB|nr:LysE family translocator [Litoreibacter meonggei]RLJ40807.1 threonine/homoserine/homoserine lactone efflux protein [Litoreibacter meonggei]
MTGVELGLLLVAWAVAGASPGPATLAIAGTSMERGRAAGLAVAAGIVCGSASWGVAAALGMSALMLANAWLVEILRYAGAAYLMYLGIKALRSGLSNKPLASVQAKRGGLRSIYLKGLLLHLTNPKAIFSWGAIFAIAVPPGSDMWVVWETFAALFVVSNLVFFGYALLFSTAAFIRGYQRMRRWFEISFGLMFGFAGLKILTARLT